MKKVIASKYWWIFLLLALIVVNYLASIIHVRYDLTQEKRYTLSQPTKQLLQKLSDPVLITVFFERRYAGRFPEIVEQHRRIVAGVQRMGANKHSVQVSKARRGFE